MSLRSRLHTPVRRERPLPLFLHLASLPWRATQPAACPSCAHGKSKPSKRSQVYTGPHLHPPSSSPPPSAPPASPLLLWRHACMRGWRTEDHVTIAVAVAGSAHHGDRARLGHHAVD